MPAAFLPKKQPKCLRSPVTKCVHPEATAALRIGKSFSGNSKPAISGCSAGSVSRLEIRTVLRSSARRH